MGMNATHATVIFCLNTKCIPCVKVNNCPSQYEGIETDNNNKICEFQRPNLINFKALSLRNNTVSETLPLLNGKNLPQIKMCLDAVNKLLL